MSAAFLFGCSGGSVPAEGDACDTLADCAAAEGLSCRGDTCARVTCERSSACPAGAACVDGVCDDPECAETADCTNDATCFEGDCRLDICSRTTDCEPGLVCSGSPPQCVDPPSECATDLDCPSGVFCKLPEASCAPLCDEESDCAGEAYCDGRFCREPCLQAAECPGDLACVEGRCVDPGDCNDVSCPAAVPFANPDSCTCQECLAEFDCAEDRTCVGGICRFCPLFADSAAECAERGFRFDGSCCVECLSDSDCTVGVALTCVRGACEVESGRECSGDGDCPAGQACDAGVCRKVGSGEACELQQDCAPGEGCYGDGRCWEVSDICDGCSAPGRCIAEDGDLAGTCAGCTDACDATSCPTGELCYLPDGAAEGTCVEASFTPNCP